MFFTSSFPCLYLPQPLSDRYDKHLALSTACTAYQSREYREIVACTYHRPASHDMSERSDSSSSSSSTEPKPHTSPSYTSSSPIRPPSSTDTLNPLLNPIGHNVTSSFSPSYATGSSGPVPSSTPEKCLTFCSQRADAPPICRMLCLRRRPKQLSRAEELERLRPRNLRAGRVVDGSQDSSSSSSSSTTRRVYGYV